MIYDARGNILFDPSQFVEFFPFADKAAQFEIAAYSSQVQGCCSDGVNLYFGNSSYMKRLNPLTGEEFTKTGLTLYHCNDTAYCPETGYIYVATMESGLIICLNAQTLEVVSSFTPTDGEGNPVASSGIAYDRKNQQFILSSSHNYAIFDSEWNWQNSFTHTTSGWTYQGLETDGDYIYRPLYSGSGNAILVLTMEGDAIKTIVSRDAGYELEGIANDWNGNWYASNNHGAGGTIDYLGFFKYTNYNAVWEIAGLQNRA